MHSINFIMKHIKATEIYHFQTPSQKFQWYLIKFHHAILATYAKSITEKKIYKNNTYKI